MNVMEELKAFALCAPPSAGLSAQARQLFYAAMEQRLRESGSKRLNSLQTLRLLKENQELCRVFAGPYGDHDAMLKVIARHADAYLEQEILVLGEMSDQLAECLKGLLVSSISTVVKYWLDTGMKAEPERVAYVLDTYCFSGIKGFLDDKDRF